MEKRNTSIITIVLLIILIVLVAAVGVYMVIRDNKPQEVTNNNNTEVTDNNSEESVPTVSDEEEKEEAKEVNLNSQVAKMMDCMTNWIDMEREDGKWKVDGIFPIDSFYGFSSDKIDSSYFDNSQLLSIAFEYYITVPNVADYKIEDVESTFNYQTAYFHMNEENMNRIMHNVFGKDIKYSHVTFECAFNAEVEYSNENKEYTYPGMGGGPTPAIVQKITKINEYSNTYEAYVKAIMYTVEFREGGGYNNIYTLKDGTVITEEPGNYNFDISNYLDNTYEFKHTFGKNEDGSIYWISTEKVN